MGKRILLMCVIILCCVGGWYLYKQYRVEKQDTDGAVVCVQNCDTPEQKARFAQENSGDTADGGSEHKQHTASQEASLIASGFPSATAPVSSNDPSQSTQSSQGYGNTQAVPNVVPAGQRAATNGASGGYGVSPNSTAGSPVAGTNNGAAENRMGMGQPAMAPVSLPLTDSRSPNAPNDLRLGGSGTYQWYRQGNLTWRIDTATGRSCIIYATLEEWQKQIVLRHGCGRNA